MADPHTSGVRWRDWGEEAFAEAERRGVPILLDISAVWCHWCHVMDRTTYNNAEVAGLIEDSFVPVKVDNDRRPDINRRYNMGGWPTTAFLTPSGEILTGGTYFPPETMQGLLRQISSAWTDRREEFETKIAQMAERRDRPQTQKGTLSSSIVERIIGGLVQRYDSRYGGFGPAPKFPHAPALELLVNRHLATGEEQLRDMLFHTLDGMSSGGMYDHVEGGFFRYSTSDDWSVPHFEKMCEDNARLLVVFLAGGTLEGGERFHKVAHDMFRYVEATLTDPDGGFHGSQDADEEYYTQGEGGRSRLEAPYVDRTLYADWNGLMARAHLLGARILNEPALRDGGLAALDRVLSVLGPPGEGFAHYFDGSRSEVGGFLGDHAELGLAFLDAYVGTGERRYLDAAKETAAFALDNLGADEGGFFDRRPGSGEGALTVPARPLEDNSTFATLLLRLGRLLRDESSAHRARDTLSIYAGGYDLYDLMGAPFALAVDELLAEPVHVSIVGDPNEGAPLRSAAVAGYRPYRLVDTLAPGRDDDLLTKTGYPVHDHAVAYVCVGTVCHPPTYDPAEIGSLLGTA
ncbi:MAG TPA: DUF255 domain-containing protein [Actinomycetota bacterium]|nr:DUF255 domain-containing protein [Actinomycetota bacterium]